MAGISSCLGDRSYRIHTSLVGSLHHLLPLSNRAILQLNGTRNSIEIGLVTNVFHCHLTFLNDFPISHTIQVKGYARFHYPHSSIRLPLIVNIKNSSPARGKKRKVGILFVKLESKDPRYECSRIDRYYYFPGARQS